MNVLYTLFIEYIFVDSVGAPYFLEKLLQLIFISLLHMAIIQGSAYSAVVVFQEVVLIQGVGTYSRVTFNSIMSDLIPSSFTHLFPANLTTDCEEFFVRGFMYTSLLRSLS